MTLFGLGLKWLPQDGNSTGTHQVAHLSPLCWGWKTSHRTENSSKLLEEVLSWSRVQIEKKWHHSRPAGEQIHTRMLFSRTDSLQVIFSLVLKVAGRAVSLASALNDCWVIYQVASGSSVGHRTWAEWERDSSGFTASDGFNPGWRYAVGGNLFTAWQIRPTWQADLVFVPWAISSLSLQ